MRLIVFIIRLEKNKTLQTYITGHYRENFSNFSKMEVGIFPHSLPCVFMAMTHF